MSKATLTVKLVPLGTALLGPVLAQVPGQMTLPFEQALVEPPALSYVEPCPECACGKCNNCDGRTLDHALDEIVPCPCRSAGHTTKDVPA